ncbi:hypothetical protein [Pontibacter roseus]|uniref:hypothetical protein n=1 Tax=Pontibacter roseus TaxID=336989 RepID=UPI00035E4F12|nr:hypothetical protein [Pontibacter roseus]
MKDREENHGRPGDENQRIGRELYQKDQQQQPTRYGYRGRSEKNWDEGNFFHTGPNPRGAQDRGRGNYPSGGSSGSSYRVGEGAHLNDHYGSQPGSHYRNESHFLNHGDRTHGSGQRPPYVQDGSQPGNYNEPPTSQDSLWREGPDTRSRYKETDFRYGSGSHNWYSEGRYSPDVAPRSDDNRGFFTKVRDTWNDIMHSDDTDYQRRQRYDQRADHLSSRQRYGSEQYRDRNFDQGYEGGPRWADETDSGKDNHYKNIDQTQRYRR